jgi:hypothetical protein
MHLSSFSESSHVIEFYPDVLVLTWQPCHMSLRQKNLVVKKKINKGVSMQLQGV